MPHLGNQCGDKGLLLRRILPLRLNDAEEIAIVAFVKAEGQVQIECINFRVSAPLRALSRFRRTLVLLLICVNWGTLTVL